MAIINKVTTDAPREDFAKNDTLVVANVLEVQLRRIEELENSNKSKTVDGGKIENSTKENTTLETMKMETPNSKNNSQGNLLNSLRKQIMETKDKISQLQSFENVFGQIPNGEPGFTLLDDSNFGSKIPRDHP